ncbi:MAG: CPBP family intramembrane metalloprotease [Lachnospiraceae bacterium]|nr:CPBP family intramembrane metalloprotease [Lachnospiraceae bacterium]
MHEKQKTNIKSINIVYLITVLIAVIVPFLPLDFLAERPVAAIIFSQIMLAFPAIIYMIVRRLPYAETVRFKKMKFADVLLALLFGILIQPVITLISALSMVFAKNVTGASIFEVADRVPFFVCLLLVAVMPAVMEETVYRGVFYNEYGKINPVKAALLSGLMFGIMHGNINQFCYAAVMGIIFALLVEATGSIISTMLVHFWTNAASVVMLYVYPKLYEIAQNYYNMYKEYGNTTMASMLEETFGDMTLPATEWTRQLMESAANIQLTVPQVFFMYGPQALIMGVLAFFVYKKLATRSGNWDRICASFNKQPVVTTEELPELEVKEKKRMVTIPWIIASLLGIAYMIVFEILLQRNM